jgi:serine/threonine-protein kinase HipA
LTKRFDRLPNGIKLDQEDFSQIASRTEETHGENYKYDFSYEEIGELIKAHVGPSLIELEKFYKLVAFNYLVQNGDAHIKNFSLFRNSSEGILLLTPAYDLANTRLHLPEEADTALDLFKDEFATPSFTANAYYAKDDFVEFGKRLGINPSRVESILGLLVSKLDSVNNLIDNSFLEDETKIEYRGHIADRVKRLSQCFSKNAQSAFTKSAPKKNGSRKKKPVTPHLD